MQVINNPINYTHYKPWEFSIIEALFMVPFQLMRIKQRTTDITLPPIHPSDYKEAKLFIENLLDESGYTYNLFTSGKEGDSLFFGLNIEVPRNPEYKELNSRILNAVYVNESIKEAENRSLDLVISLIYSKMSVLMYLSNLHKSNSFELEGIPTLHLNNVTSVIRKWLQDQGFTKINFQYPPIEENSSIIILGVFFEVPPDK
jgi:hypothetical protein